MPKLPKDIADRVEDAKRALGTYDPNFLALTNDEDREGTAISLMLALMHYSDSLSHTSDALPDLLQFLRDLHTEDITMGEEN